MNAVSPGAVANSSQKLLSQPRSRQQKTQRTSWTHKLTVLGRNLAILGVVLLAVHVTIDVLLRYFFNIVLPGTFEFTVYMWMPFIVFLPLASAAMTNEHIRMPLLLEKLGGRHRIVAELLLDTTTLVIASGLAIAQLLSTRLAFVNAQATSGSVELPLWPGKAIALIGLILLALVSLQQASTGVRELTGKRVTARGKIVNSLPHSYIYFTVAIITMAILTYMFAASPSREALGVLSLVLLLALIALGASIGVSLIVASILGIQQILGTEALMTSVPEILFNAGASWQLSVIPLFVVVGAILWSSGIASKAFATIVNFLGRAPGGLAVSTTAAGAGLASVSGSSIGITYALGRIALPEMLKRNYSPSIATASVAMVGTLGQLIPPSIQLVVYAGVVQVSVGQQLFAGIVPGVLIAILFALFIMALATIRPSLMPRETKPIPWGKKLRSLPGIIPILVVVVVIVGGIASGAFTVTEAAGVGAVTAAIVALFMSRSNAGANNDEHWSRGFISAQKKALTSSVGSIASVFFLLIGVYIFTRFLTVTRITNIVAGFVVDFGLPYAMFILVLVLIYIVLGMFLDPMAMILITVPILNQSFAYYEIDPIWFGVFIIIMAEIAMVTPPVGILGFIVHRIAQDPEVNGGKSVSLTQVFSGVVGFILIALGVVALLAAYPEIVLWLPELLIE